MGRPTKLTPTIQNAVCRELEAGLPRHVAAVRGGISYTTFRRWVSPTQHPGENFDAFRTAIKKAEADAVAKFAGVIETAAVETWQAAAWWLERRHPDDWGATRNELKQLREQVKALVQMMGGKGAAATRKDGPKADRKGAVR